MGLHAAFVVCLPWFSGFAPGPQEPAAATDVLRAVMVAPVQPNLAEGLVVEVVDETGKPADGAIVGYFVEDPNQPDETRRRAMEALFPRDKPMDEDRRLATLLLAFGTRYRADANGRAFLPNDARRPVIACWDGLAATESGAATANGAPVRIVLLRPISVRVRVVDPDGKPVAYVRLAVNHGERSAFGHTLLTDRRGETDVPIPRYMRNPPQVLRIEARLGLEEDPVARFASDAIPRDPIVLKLPATGLVRVIVYGDDEKPLANVSGVVLNAVPPRGGGWALGGQAEPSGAVVRVPLGQSYRVHATLHGVSGDVTGTVKGPTQANELIVCDLRATQGPPMVSFVVRGLDGEPVRDEDLGYVTVSAQLGQGREVRSDRDGRVRIVLAAQRPEDLELLVLRRGLGQAPHWPSQYQGAARIALPRDLHAGENSLGDVRLAEESLYVAGQVDDDEGRPVANAIVTCDPGWRRESGGWSGGGYGRQFFEHRVLTGADGRFELRDVVQQPNVLVNAWSPQPGLAPASMECAAGSRTAKLVLHRTGRLTLVLGGLPDTPHGLLEGSVEPAGGGAEVRQFSVHGAQTVLVLAAGRYDLVLRVDDKGPAVLRLANVEVPAGGESKDPQLQHAPWRDHLALVTLTIVDHAQKPVKDRTVVQYTEKPGGGYGGTGGRTDQDGKVTLLVPKAGGHLAIWGGGGVRGAGLERVTTDQTIVLPPALAAVIELRGDRTVPEGIQSEFKLQYAGKPNPDFLQSLLHGVENPVLRAGRPGTFEAAIGQPGTFEVHFVVTEPLEVRKYRLHSFGWGTIDVKDQLEPQSFVLEMPAAERERFEALIERLKQ